MMMSVRQGVSALDSVLASVRVNHWLAETVVLSWDRRHQSAAVMGLLDESGQMLDVSSDVLSRLTGMLARPMVADVLRLAFPDADLNLSGQVMINMPVDEPVWARVITNVEERVRAGLRVSSDDVRDALWATLEAVGVFAGSATLDRVVMFPDLPDDIVFEPITLSSHQNGAGESMPWLMVEQSMPHPEVSRALRSLLNALALREERLLSAGSSAPMVMTRVVVSI